MGKDLVRVYLSESTATSNFKTIELSPTMLVSDLVRAVIEKLVTVETVSTNINQKIYTIYEVKDKKGTFNTAHGEMICFSKDVAEKPECLRIVQKMVF